MSTVDFGRHSDDYARFRPGPPAPFYQRLDALAPIRGLRALDLATGPGTIALELAARGASVVGIDISAEQIAAAELLAEQRDLGGTVRFERRRAEQTEMDSDSFDLVTAGQCWHWFDGPAALREVCRVLRPGGLLVIVNNCYLAEHSPVARETEELIVEFNPEWTMAGWNGLFPDQIDAVVRGGFRLVEQFCFDYGEEFSHARWRGRIRTCNGVGSGGMKPTDVECFDRALADLLKRKYPAPLSVEHRLWSVVGRKPS